MKRFGSLLIVSYGFFLGAAAGLDLALAESTARLDCTVPSSPSTRLEIEAETVTILEGGQALAQFAIPLLPAMASANGSITASYSSPDFVLTLTAEALSETAPEGDGFAAFRLPNASPLAFEVTCSASHPPIETLNDSPATP